MIVSPKIHQPAGVLLMLLTMLLKACGQTYEFSTPVSGGLDLNVSDYGIFLSGQQQVSGSSLGAAYVSFDALYETVIYDPVNQTLRQTGYITLNPATSTSTLSETRTVNSQQVTASVTVQQQITGGVIAFDSGVVPMNSLNPGYPYYAHFTTPIQITGSYSLVTGGQTYTGDFSPTLTFDDSPGIGLPYYSITPGGDGSSLMLSGGGGEAGNVSAADSFNGGPTFYDRTAADGFELSLYSGAGADPFHQFSLQAPTTITATAVPEPSSLALLLAGILSRSGYRRKMRS